VTGVLIFGIRVLVQNFRVEGISMLPSFAGGQVLVVNRAAYFHVYTRYLFGGPQRGDVAVFRAPPQPDTDYIKRIIGLPGDRILIVDGVVFVNDRRLAEPYVRSPAAYTFPTDGKAMSVPDGHYFVLGDNRPESFDSHMGWLVSVDDLVGRAWIRYWPLNEVAIAQPT
jgi:signal peptidase I